MYLCDSQLDKCWDFMRVFWVAFLVHCSIFFLPAFWCRRPQRERSSKDCTRIDLSINVGISLEISKSFGHCRAGMHSIFALRNTNILSGQSCNLMRFVLDRGQMQQLIRILCWRSGVILLEISKAFVRCRAGMDSIFADGYEYIGRGQRCYLHQPMPQFDSMFFVMDRCCSSSEYHDQEVMKIACRRTAVKIVALRLV